MTSKLRAGTPFIALAIMAIAVLMIASCRTDNVEVPPLTGPSGARLFLTMEASPDKIFIKTPNHAPPNSRIVVQLKDQLGHPVPNETIAFRIINSEGAEVAIGTLDARTRATDSGGFARVTYTAPSSDAQPVATRIYVLAVMTNPAFTFEVTARQKLDLELARPVNCVGGPGAPAVSFKFTPADPTINNSVCFDAQGTTDNGQIVSYSWSFGDGGTASGIVACHTYRKEGSFTVTLTVVDDDRNCVSVSQFLSVNTGTGPLCVFTASPNPVNTDTVVLFDAAGSSDVDGNVVGFKWDFGDGKTGSGEKTSHTYTFIGTFTVTLTVRDDSGNESTCTNSITVGTSAPKCSFTIAPNPADVNEVVTFDGSASSDPQGGPLTFAWDFDDDGAFDDDTGVIATTSFSTKGTKIINLQVTDNEQNSSVCTQALTVGNSPPSCDVFTSDATGTVIPGTTVNFTVTASDPDGDPLSVKFTATGASPSQALDSTAPFTFSPVFTATGTVTAVVSDGFGGTDTCTPIAITVQNNAPVCESFTATSTNITVGQSIDFVVTGSDPDGNPITVQFVTTGGSPGGSVDNAAPFQQLGTVYNTAGPFTANATVKDSFGATDVCPSIPITVSAVVPVVTIDDATPLLEGNAGTKQMPFTVHLDQATTATVTVNYITVDGTATSTAPADYVAVTSGQLIITPGNTSGIINITINGDVTIEPDETFQVQITNVTNGTAGSPSVGNGTILNDD